MGAGEDGFMLDEEKLAFVINDIWKSVLERRGIFAKGIKRFLPQWNIPKEFEHDPQTTRTKDPKNAAKFLFTRTSLDKLSLSSYLHRRTLETWADEEKRWIFYPENVIVHDEVKIGSFLKKYFNYGIPISQKVSAGKAYLNNARIIMDEYNGDPRNLILNKSVEQARGEIQKLTGFGTGLANLLMIEYCSREIACPTDLINLKPKIDRHKARIPINTGVIKLLNHWKEKGYIHSDALVERLEDSYVRVAAREGLDLIEIDAALWIIGSEICSQRNYNLCKKDCPLVDGHCNSNATLEHNNGYFRVYNRDGSPFDARERNGQTFFKI
jgi:hypothetical protein